MIGTRSAPETRSAVALSGSYGRVIVAVESSDCKGFEPVEINNAAVKLLGCAPAESNGAKILDSTRSTLWLSVWKRVLVSNDLGRSQDS